MKLKIAISSIIIFLIVFFTFSNAFQNHFVSWDDMDYVLENNYVLEKKYTALKKEIVSLNYHPLTMWSLAANVEEDLKEIAGNNEDIPAKNFIQTNVFFHALNAILVFLLVYFLLGEYWLALFVALVFAVHPLRTESVVWVSERKDVLYVFFSLMTVLIWVKYVKSKQTLWYFAALLAFVAACLSKATAVIVPVIFIGVDYYLNRKDLYSKALIEKIPFFFFSFLFGIIAVKIQSGSDFNSILHNSNPFVKALSTEHDFTFIHKIFIACYGFSMYVWKLFFPFNLSPLNIYPDSKEIFSLPFLLSLVFVIAFAVLLFWAFKKQEKVLFFGMAWYVVSLVLLLQIISVGIAIYADRYSYLAHIGIVLSILFLLNRIIKEKVKNEYVFVAIMSVIVFALITLTRKQNEVWNNTETLWNKAIEVNEKNAEAYINRGNFVGKRGNIAAALNDFKEARNLGSKNAKMFEGLGNCFGVLSEQNSAYRDSSILMFSKSIELNPTAYNALYNRALTYLKMQKYSEAIADFEQAMQLNNSREAFCKEQMALCYLNMKNYDQALQKANESMASGNNSVQILLIRGDIYLLQNKKSLAIKDYEEALRINPNLNNVKSVLSQLKTP